MKCDYCGEPMAHADVELIKRTNIWPRAAMNRYTKIAVYCSEKCFHNSVFPILVQFQEQEDE